MSLANWFKNLWLAEKEISSMKHDWHLGLAGKFRHLVQLFLIIRPIGMGYVVYFDCLEIMKFKKFLHRKPAENAW